MLMEKKIVKVCPTKKGGRGTRSRSLVYAKYVDNLFILIIENNPRKFVKVVLNVMNEVVNIVQLKYSPIKFGIPIDFGEINSKRQFLSSGTHFQHPCCRVISIFNPTYPVDILVHNNKWDFTTLVAYRLSLAYIHSVC